MKKLPIGISTLSKILDNDMLYVDKTKLAYEIAAQAGAYFLSRPRRFGKSLFLDTLKEIFEGNKELFKDLYIYDKWNWEHTYPVIKIDFVVGGITNPEEFTTRLTYILKSNAERLKLDISYDTDIPGVFTNIIKAALQKYQTQVVLLIDEYDKPLLDNIENPERMMVVRELLKNFYSVIKEQDANLQFVFLTGVSKFSKVSIFSGINNLQDITLDERYATVCGYTQNDLETVFAEHLLSVDRPKLKKWYNGYNFLGDKVYNPFDILLFIANNYQYKNYWFETGTPTFLVKLFQKNKYFLPDLETLEVGEELLSSFDIRNLEPTTILFQAGYLTIRESYTEMEKLVFKLCFPNFEVKTSFNEYLITGYTDYTTEKIPYERAVYNALMTADMSQLEKTIKRLFSGIPYRNFTHNDLLNFEGYYCSVLYAFFSAINCEVIPEDISCRGQADITVKLGSNIYVIEVKVGKDEESKINEALIQIQERAYSAKYKGIPDTKVCEIGMIFDPEKRSLQEFGYCFLS